MKIGLITIYQDPNHGRIANFCKPEGYRTNGT